MDFWIKCPFFQNKNFRNPANYIPLDPEIYADNYLRRDHNLKSNCNKAMTRIRLSNNRLL